jgi:hypothetical protein
VEKHSPNRRLRPVKGNLWKWKSSRIIINETSDQQIIVLKERHGSGLPIVIGIVEIFAIDRRLSTAPAR